MARITGHPRYKTGIDWKSGLWADKPFRLWELVFFRKFEIRVESSASVDHVNGELHVTRKFYTLEALLCHAEATLRSYFSAAFWRLMWAEAPKHAPRYAYVSIAIAGMVLAFKTKSHGMILPIIGMAIAVDATGSAADDASPMTVSFTTSGSDRKMFVGIHNGAGDTETAVTYNSVSMSQTEKSAAGNLTEEIYLYDLTAPASGAHTLSLTRTGSGRHRCGIVSYTGCNGTIDVHGNNKAHGGMVTVTLTVVASNCWIIGSGGGQDPAAAGTNMTSRANPGGVVVGDSNGVVGTGSQSIGASDSGTGDCGVCAAAFQPGTQATVNGEFFKVF